MEKVKMEDVVRGLQCLIGGEKHCDECKYEEWGMCRCDLLVEDTIKLLKAQEPRLLTIEEITGDGECWFEGINGACGYADCYMCTGSKEVEINRISMRPEYVSWDDFKKKWRCWSARPTDEQRKAVKWE